MNRILILVVAILFSNSLAQNILGPSQFNTPVETNTLNRTVRITSSKEYDIDADSVYWNDRIEKPALSIASDYREIIPSKIFDLDLLGKELETEEIFQNPYYLGDTFVPYLLNEESIYISDEQFVQALAKTDLDVYIFYVDDFLYQHRIFLLSPKPHTDSFFYDNSAYCFVQSWNEKELRAQPLFEDIYYTFDLTDSFYVLTSSDGFSENTLLFSGYNTLESYGEGKGILAPVLLSWTWNGSCWLPSNFREIFELETVKVDSKAEYLINICKDGIRISIDYPQLEDGSYTKRQYYYIKISKDKSIFINEVDSGNTIIKLNPIK